MKRYHLSAVVGVSAHTIVEAETPEEAVSVAQERPVELGGLRSGNDPEEVWIIEEGDGEPTEIRVEEREAGK